MRVCVASVLVALMAAGSAMAQGGPDVIDGNKLWVACGRTTTGQVPPACSGYVVGVYDTLTAIASTSRLPRLICIGTGVNGAHLAEAVRKYLADHPESRQHTGVEEVEGALAHAFPCH
jgi:hypothetical protein